MKATFRFLFLATAFTSVAVPATAQQPRQLAPTRVTLVADKVPSKGGRVEVVRRAELKPQNIVIVDRNASADDLAGALAMINALRTQHGEAITDDFRARPESVKHGKNWKKSAYRAWLVDQLDRLKKAERRDVPGLGVVKAVRITLPAPAAVTATGGGRE